MNTGNVETNETSPGNEDISYAQVVKPPTKRTPEKTRLAQTQVKQPSRSSCNRTVGNTTGLKVMQLDCSSCNRAVGRAAGL
ncbi:hypothetical protein MAR_021763 [Mya arenaria]|uniref:Uncharacterized protein n=1 Tax=Mya arenaria TaxID=6604 RepID=A0ABY7EDC2_MYAAR|nr:hypothetical protein MAR_021763 [Mya arenaria]